MEPLVTFSLDKSVPTYNKHVLSDDILVRKLPHSILTISSDNISQWDIYNLNEEEQYLFIAEKFPDKLKLYESYEHSEEKTNLFIYLWLYINGGIYLSPSYQLKQSPEYNTHDLYFIYDSDGYISPDILISMPFCNFWLEVVTLMERRQHHKYADIRDQIDRNTGRSLLTDMVDETYHNYRIISPNDYFKHIDDKISVPQQYNVIYTIGAVIIIIIIMIIIIMLTR